MKLHKVYMDDDLWTKLGEIARDMDRKGINVKGDRNTISLGAAIRELVKAYDLPAKPKTPNK